MTTSKQNLKWAAKLLSFLILLQSCTVYHKYTSSADEAVASNNKVKLEISKDEYPYKFKSIKVFENEYYGLARIKSDTYKRLSGRKKIDLNKKFTYVQLLPDELDDIHLKNKGVSLALSIGIPVIVVGGIAVAAGASYSPSIDMQWGKPEM